MFCCTPCLFHTILFPGFSKLEQLDIGSDSLVFPPQGLMTALSCSNSLESASVSFKFNLSDEDSMFSDTSTIKTSARDTLQEGEVVREATSENSNRGDRVGEEANTGATASKDANGSDLICEAFSGHASNHSGTVQRATVKKKKAKANARKAAIKREMARRAAIKKLSAKRTTSILCSGASNLNIPGKQMKTGVLPGLENLPFIPLVRLKMKCKKCGESSTNLKEHACEEPLKRVQPCKLLPCHLCQKLFKESALKLHLLSHYGIPCVQCHSLFPDRKLLEIHSCVPREDCA